MEPSSHSGASGGGPLQQYLEAVFGLQELVDVANALLPGYLPKDATGRAADDVNPRLVRFYTTEGLIPEPHKEGREARYVYDHLLALLLVRKLLAEGFGSAAIRKALSGRLRAELEALLQDEVRVELAPSQPVPQALGEPRIAAPSTAKDEFLRQVRARAGLGGKAADPGAGAPMRERSAARRQEASRLELRVNAFRSAPDADTLREMTAAYASAPAGVETTWNRLSIHDGLELSVRDDFTWPANHVAEEQLLQQMRVALLQLEQARKRRG
jgi:DNA-binding transcriptional MerR regulator